MAAGALQQSACPQGQDAKQNELGRLALCMGRSQDTARLSGAACATIQQPAVRTTAVNCPALERQCTEIHRQIGGNALVTGNSACLADGTRLAVVRLVYQAVYR